MIIFWWTPPPPSKRKPTVRWNSKFTDTVEPRLTNTLLKRTPLLNELFWPVPNIFLINSCLKTSPWANNLVLPVQRTAVCPPKPSAHGVLELAFRYDQSIISCKLSPLPCSWTMCYPLSHNFDELIMTCCIHVYNTSTAAPYLELHI